jgi:serine/threonine-protein kinase
MAGQPAHRSTVQAMGREAQRSREPWTASVAPASVSRREAIVPTCPSCKAPCTENVRFCPLCGAALTAATGAAAVPARTAGGVIDVAAGVTRSLKPVPPTCDELVGKLIDGRYRILGRVGEGGVGVVYRADHIQLRRPVAVKMLHALFATYPEFRLRFEREALAASKASHPACVAVLDFGDFEGRPYLVMEFVEGRLLSERLAEGPLPPAHAALLTREILRGLRHTHELGIVHRDLKPGNIMLCEPARTGSQVKLLDFGLAKHLGHGDPGSSTLTQVGSVFGTPGYISPEQALGLAVDARSDLYSLGVVLFEMVCGQRPFVSDDQLHVIRAHIATPAPRARALRPELGPALDAVIARALEKERAERFQTADDFSQALARAAEADGVLRVGDADARPAPGSAAVDRGVPRTSAAAPEPTEPAGPVDAPGRVRATPAPTPPPIAAARSRRGARTALAGGAVVVLAAAVILGLVAASWMRDLSPARRPAPPHPGLGPTAAGGTRPAGPHGAARTPGTPPRHVTPKDAPRAAPPRETAARAAASAPAPAAPAPASPEPASPEVRRAEADLAAGRIESAIRRARHVAGKQRQDPRPHLVLGHAYFRKGWHNDAIEEFRKAVRLDPAVRGEAAMLHAAVGCLARRGAAPKARTFLVHTVGAPAIPALREGLTHRDQDVRRRAGDALAKLER